MIGVILILLLPKYLVLSLSVMARGDNLRHCFSAYSRQVASRR